MAFKMKGWSGFSPLKQKKVKISKHLINPNLKVKKEDSGTISQGKEIKGKFDKITVDKDKLTNILVGKTGLFGKKWENPFSTKRKKTKFQ